jgi:hypothetical protein
VLDKTVSTVHEVAARGGRATLVTDPRGREATVNSLLPETPSTVMPLAYYRTKCVQCAFSATI